MLLIYLKSILCGWLELELPTELKDGMSGEIVSLSGAVYHINKKEFYQEIYIEGNTHCWRVTDYSYEPLSLGNNIQIIGKLSLPEEARNPGNFNPKEYYTKKHIIATVEATSINVIDASVYRVRETLRILRMQGVEKVYEIMGKENGAFLVAILFGEKDDMNEEQKILYQKLGISHIFAISGLHISFLSLILYQLVRKRTGSYVIAGIIGVLMLCLYVILTGSGVSAIRAGIMFAIRVGADVTGRVYDIRTSLAIAAVCIVIPMPNYLIDGGFLLSFGAILGIIYVVPVWTRILARLGKRGEGLGATLGIQATLLPVMLYFFYEASPYAFALNLIVIPAMTVLLAFAILGVTLSFLCYPLAFIGLNICGLILEIIQKICGILIHIPYARVVTGVP